MEYFELMIPCEFCHVRLPNRYSTVCEETWQPELELFHLPLDETIFSVDRELSDVSARDMKRKFKLARSRIRKIHCIYAKGDIFKVRHMEPCFGRLNSLNLNGLVIGRCDLKRIAQSTVRLEELVLRVYQRVGCKYFKELYRANSRLRHVHIIDHRPKKCTCLSQLPAHSMESLSLTGCIFPINFFEFATEWKKISRLLVESCINVPADFIKIVFFLLQQLKVFRYHFSFRVPRLYDIEPSEYARNITVLVLFNNVLIDDGLIVQICYACKNLEHLFLGILVFNTQYAEIQGLQGLPRFTLMDITVSGLCTLKKLSCLGFFGIHIEADNTNMLYTLATIKNLEVLYLVTSNNYNLTQVACHIFKHCYKLHTLLLLGYIFRRRDLLNVIKAVERFEDESPEFMLRLLVNSTFAERDYSPHPNIMLYPTMEQELLAVIERVCA